MPYSQEGRSLVLNTPLGPDKLLLTGLRGREAVSDHFSFHLEMLSDDHAILPEAIVGKPVLVGMRQADGSMRPIHGRIGRFWMGWTTPEGLRKYQAEVVPWFWFLRRTSDSRVFRNLSVPEIAAQVFDEFEFADFDTSLLREKHARLDYSVQYQESYYDYLCRLFEAEGISFYFRHEEDRHVLVLTDTNAGFRAGTATDLPYTPALDQLGYVTDWNHRFAFQPARLATRDYDPNKPSALLDMQLPSLMEKMAVEKANRYIRFEWPGEYASHDEGDTVLRRRLQELDVGFHLVEGASTCPGFTAGDRIRLAEHPDPWERNNNFYLLSVEHEAEDTSVVTRDSGSAYRYRNSFLAFPSFSRVYQLEKHYRPLRRTPKPRIHGVQTAVVVGPPGETIHCDQQGRVKVQFHWDRHGPKDDGSSCWVRVSQSWAGAKFGSMQIPHVGQEVLVAFQEGDPDRPVIVGRVYNADQKNPTVLNAIGRKTQTALRDHGGNQFLTEGKEGHERIELHSPKGSAHAEMGAVTKPHPATQHMAKFAAAFPSASLGASGGGGGGGGAGAPPQAQAREEAPFPRRTEETAPRQTRRDGDRQGVQAQAADEAEPPSSDDATGWDGWWEFVKGTFCRASTDNWDITNGNKYECTDGNEYSVVNGDRYEANYGNKYEYHRGWLAYTEAACNELFLHGGAVEDLFLGAKLDVSVGLNVEYSAFWKFSFHNTKMEVNVEKSEFDAEVQKITGSVTQVSGDVTALDGEVKKFSGLDNRVQVVEDKVALTATKAQLDAQNQTLQSVQDVLSELKVKELEIEDSMTRVKQGLIDVCDKVIFAT